jgi:hypothetical protein
MIEPVNPQITVLAPDAAVAPFRYKGCSVDTTTEARDVTSGITLIYERRGEDGKIVQVHESVSPLQESQ